GARQSTGAGNPPPGLSGGVHAADTLIMVWRKDSEQAHAVRLDAQPTPLLAAVWTTLPFPVWLAPAQPYPENLLSISVSTASAKGPARVGDAHPARPAQAATKRRSPGLDHRRAGSPGTPDMRHGQPNRSSPQYWPRRRPGGQAKIALPVCWMYSLSASAARERWIWMNWPGSFMKAM